MRRLLAAVVAAAAGWVGFAVYSEAASSHALDARVQQLDAQNRALRQEIAGRQREVAQADSNQWLEVEARKLGYVKPGEHVYIVTAPGQPLPGPGGVDIKNLPSFQPSPPAGGAAPPVPPSPAPSGTATPPPGPTPYQFTLTAPGH